MNKQTLLTRFWQYQRERFPLAANGVLIGVFTLSAVLFSFFIRGGEHFVPPAVLLSGAFTVFLFFLLLRIFDEFKDANEDRKYRPYRPVPRGLISFGELTRLAWLIVGLQVLLNLAVGGRLLLLYAAVLAYILLMRVEFFAAAFLKSRPLLYLFSHMLVMPLLAFYATALDWQSFAHQPSFAVFIFCLLNFFNGLVIEIGRKIRRPEDEEAGVETYSFLWGVKAAVYSWCTALLAAYLTALFAARALGQLPVALPLFTLLLLLTLKPATALLRSRQPQSLSLEKAAGLWTLGAYLLVGLLPVATTLVRGAF